MKQFKVLAAPTISLLCFLLGWWGSNLFQKTHRCYSEKACVFGPGIVGVQECVGGELQDCEPDPKFKYDADAVDKLIKIQAADYSALSKRIQQLERKDGGQ